MNAEDRIERAKTLYEESVYGGDVSGLADAERQAFAPMLAILSAQHETQYSRLFRS